MQWVITLALVTMLTLVSEAAGRQGETTRLPFDPLAVKASAIASSHRGGVLLFSDNPETVSGYGVLSQSVLAGGFRVVLHHVNGDDDGKFFLVALRNTGSIPALVTVRKAGVAGPGLNYTSIGQRALATWFADDRSDAMLIPPGEARWLGPWQDRPASHKALVTAIYDGTILGLVEVSVVSTDAPENVTEDVLPATRHRLPGVTVNQGIFPFPDREVRVTATGRRQVFRLASNQPEDPYLPGIDWIRRTFAINYGNYGVIYDVRVSFAASRRARVYLTGSTRGVCGFAGAVRLQPSGRIIHVPAEGKPLLKDPRDAVLIAEVGPGRGEMRFEFMPPGGSCLPALLIVDPVR